MNLEFIVIGRPVSFQTRKRNKVNLENWKNFVKTEASKVWTGQPYAEDLYFPLVYLYDGDPAADMDNT